MTSHDWSHMLLAFGIIVLAVGLFCLAMADLAR